MFGITGTLVRIPAGLPETAVMTFMQVCGQPRKSDVFCMELQMAFSFMMLNYTKVDVASKVGGGVFNSAFSLYVSGFIQ